MAGKNTAKNKQVMISIPFDLISRIKSETQSLALRVKYKDGKEADLSLGDKVLVEHLLNDINEIERYTSPMVEKLAKQGYYGEYIKNMWKNK